MSVYNPTDREKAQRQDADELIAEYAERLACIYRSRTAGDYTFTGVLAEFLNAVDPGWLLTQAGYETHHENGREYGTDTPPSYVAVSKSAIHTHHRQLWIGPWLVGDKENSTDE